MSADILASQGHEIYRKICNYGFMNEKNLNWEDLKLFLAVARTGGLSAAMTTTGKSAPTLSRRISALEQATGQELFERLPRGYLLTPEGETLLKQVQPIEAQIARFDQLGKVDKKVLVKISAGSWMTFSLMRHLEHLLQDNAHSQLRFIAAEQILDISHRQTIIGLRNRRPEQLELACRRTGQVQFAVYARNKSVKRWARVLAKTPTAQWLENHTENEDAIEVSSPRNALDLAKLGLSKALLPTFVGDREASLQKIGATIPELSHEQWLVTHQDERYRPEVRLCIDRIFTACQLILQKMP